MPRWHINHTSLHHLRIYAQMWWIHLNPALVAPSTSKSHAHFEPQFNQEAMLRYSNTLPKKNAFLVSRCGQKMAANTDCSEVWQMMDIHPQPSGLWYDWPGQNSWPLSKAHSSKGCGPLLEAAPQKNIHTLRRVSGPTGKLCLAQVRYSNQWSNREVLLLLVENYNQYPALDLWNTSSRGNFCKLFQEQGNVRIHTEDT